MNGWQIIICLGIALGFIGCVNKDVYEESPEGTQTGEVPSYYQEEIIGGISYWGWHGHYYRHWPNYGWVVVRPPHNRPPHERPPKPVHPIVKPKPKPVQPIARPVDRPSTQPVHRPSTRPSQPSYNPRPATRPMPPSRARR